MCLLMKIIKKHGQKSTFWNNKYHVESSISPQSKKTVMSLEKDCFDHVVFKRI